MGNGYYLFSASMVNKSNQSVVAMASYRSDEKLYSERDGLTKKYKDHTIKPESFILSPHNAPSWTKDREKLWNEVETYEDRDNAQLARNILLGLPNDMTNEQQLELTKEYVQEEFVDEGMVADVSIHRDDKNNPHAHILLTVREFNKNKEWEKSKSKRIPVLDKEGNQLYNAKGWKMTRSIKINDWDSRSKLVQWREGWSEKLNEKSKEFDLEKVYNHESYEKQNLVIKPTNHLTLNAYQYEDRLKKEAIAEGKEYVPQTYYAKENEEIKLYNKKVTNEHSIEDHLVKKEYDDKLSNARKSVHADSEDYKQIKLLVDRAKGYVDFGIAKSLYNDFHNDRNKWKLKLERDHASVKSERNLSNKIVAGYEDNPEIVAKFGYSVEDFKEQMASELSVLDGKEEKLVAEFNKYQELKEATVVSLNYQVDVTDAEFKAIYSEVPDKQFTSEEKYYAINQLKNHSNYIPEKSLKEEYKSVENKQEFNLYVPVWKQAKDALVSIDIYDRAIAKHEKLNPEKVEASKYKNEIIKAQTMVYLKEDYELYAKGIEPLLDEDINQKIGMKDIDLNSVKIPVKVAMLEKHSTLSVEEKENLNEKDFLNTMKTEVDQEQKAIQGRLEEDYENEDEKEVHKDISSNLDEVSNGLFSVLDQLHKVNQQENSKAVGKTRKLFRRRGMDGREI